MNRAFYIFVFLVFLALQWPHAVMQNDDYAYALIEEDGEAFCTPAQQAPMRLPVESLGDIALSQSRHYLYSNGRVIIHALVQAAIAWVDYRIIAVLLALASTICIWLMVRVVIGDARITLARQLALLALFMAVLPCYSFNIVWAGGVAMSFNYVFPSLAMLWVFYMIRRGGALTARWGRWANAGLAAAGFVIGELHEGFSLPLIAAVATIMIWRRRELGTSIWYLFAGLAAGTLVTVIAPGNWTRIPDDRDLSWMGLRYSAIVLRAIYYPVIALVAAIGILACFRRLRSPLSRALRPCWPYAVMGVVSWVFVMSSGYIAHTRSFYPLGWGVILSAGTVAMALLRSPSRAFTRAFCVIVACTIAALTATAYNAGMRSQRARLDNIRRYAMTPDDDFAVIPDTYTPRSWMPYVDWGPLQVAPWETHLLETVEEQRLALYYHNGRYYCNFLPDEASVAAADCLYDSPRLRVLTRPGAWWIILEGPDAPIYDARFSKYRYRDPDMRLLNAVRRHPPHLWPRTYEYATLDTDSLPLRRKLIFKPADADVSELALRNTLRKAPPRYIFIDLKP